MPEEVAKIGIDGPVRPIPARTKEVLSVDTVVPQVFFLSQYSTTQAQKAAELTIIVKGLLSVGIYTSLQAAFDAGIPVGTFVIIDDPETPEKDFLVQVVRDMGDRRDAEVGVRQPA